MATDADRRAIVDKIRQDNEDDFGSRARQAVQSQLGAGHPHPWMYVYELTQNACDAGARRVAWEVQDQEVLFQHDGNIPLDEPHVRGIASLGASTKGLNAVGFMGIGFKSVFARFREVRVSGFGWHFKFSIGARQGDLGSSITEWFDTLRPCWDEESFVPDSGYTTAFLLSRSTEKAQTIDKDLARITSPNDPTPLAVLALRGLQQIRVGDVVWDLSLDNDVVEVHRSKHEVTWRWKSFVSCYRPDDNAMRRFLEVRQETRDQIDAQGQRVKRKVIALLPLDDAGLPKPPDHGNIYATLPTQVQLPFGFHLQADWLVNMDRRNLREVAGDPWQEAIVRQVPNILRQFFLWLREESDVVRKRGYPALCDPRDDPGYLSKSFQALHDVLIQELGNMDIVPIHGADIRQFCTPKKVACLPGRFCVDFGKKPQWRPDLLFDHDLMDEDLLATRATAFAHWLGWGSDIKNDDIPWEKTLPQWWSTLPKNEQTDALFALWHGIGELGWNDAPVVPTDAGKWIQASKTRWVNEEPPTKNEPSGTEIAAMLAEFLPSDNERLPRSIHLHVNRIDNPGTQWLKRQRHMVKLVSLVEQACNSAKDQNNLPLVELAEWAMSRGETRRDLVPLVLTEQGACKPSEALLADPLVEGGKSRRLLFSGKPALVEDYDAIIADQRAIILFLERLGVVGGGTLEKKITNLRGWTAESKVAKIIGCDTEEVARANREGYTVHDHTFPFGINEVPKEALQDWMSREHAAFRNTGKIYAESSYHGFHKTMGRNPSSWASALEEDPWLLCKDGQRRKPGDVLLEADLDHEDPPIADITEGLASRLEAEGVRFGRRIPQSPVLRRLTRRGAADMSDENLATLLQEAHENVTAGIATLDELLHALDKVKVRGVPLMSRVVQKCGVGSGLRSNLRGWVIALSDVAPELASVIEALELPIPETTTGVHALDFLGDIWERRPDQVETLRGYLAAAYGYVLDDAKHDTMLGTSWHEVRNHAQLYGQGKWHQVGPNLAVDDVQSPLIRRYLSENKTIVASAHLGDSNEQIHRVASALNLRLLSDDVKIFPGSLVDYPSEVIRHRLRRLIKTVALLPGRRTLREIEFRNNLSLRIDGTDCSINAYVNNGIFMLVGESKNFAAEAADQLVEHFRLSQRGTEVTWLTGALFALDNENDFAHHLQVLADGLGISPHPPLEDIYEIETENLEKRPDQPTANNEKTPGSKATSQPRYRPHNGGSKSNNQSKKPHRAIDQFGILVHSGNNKKNKQGNTKTSQGGRKSDHKARKAVLEYEMSHGRQAQEMPDNHPGFDIRSVDASAKCERRIEVKGVQGIFEDNSSVLLTDRQVRDALQNCEPDVEYWLYIVDSTETTSPRVLPPIPWTRHDPRYGFYAREWGDAAE